MKYDELMDKIEVTDAMRARILRNVSAAAPKKTPVRRYALLAACLAVVLLGAVCVPKLMDPAPQGEQVAIANGMIEVADAAALADAVGFPAAEAAEVAEVVLPIIIQAAAGDKADGRVRFRRFCLREPL